MIARRLLLFVILLFGVSRAAAQQEAVEDVEIAPGAAFYTIHVQVAPSEFGRADTAAIGLIAEQGGQIAACVPAEPGQVVVITGVFEPGVYVPAAFDASNPECADVHGTFSVGLNAARLTLFPPAPPRVVPSQE